MSAPPPPPPPPACVPIAPPPPPAFSAPAKPGTGKTNNANGGQRPDNSQLLREIERGVALRRVPEGQINQSPRPQAPSNGPANGPQSNGVAVGTEDEIAVKKKLIQDELNSTLQRRQKGERIRPHFVLPKNSTINAIYNQLAQLDSQQQAPDADPNRPLQHHQQQPYQTRLINQDYFEEMPPKDAGTFSGSNSPAAPAQQQYASTLPRAKPEYEAYAPDTNNNHQPSTYAAATLPRAAPAPAGLMISHGKPNFVRPTTASPVIRAQRANDDPPAPAATISAPFAPSADNSDLTQTLRRLRSNASAERDDASASASSAGSPAPATANASPGTASPFGARIQTPPNGRSANASPFLVRNNMPIMLQQSAAPAVDTRSDEDISNVIRRLRSVESPERASPAENLVVFNNTNRPQISPSNGFSAAPIAAGPNAPAVQWTFVPNSTGGPSTSGGFQHTIEYAPSAHSHQSSAPVQQSNGGIHSHSHNNQQKHQQPSNGSSAHPQWTFSSPNGEATGFHQTVEYPSESGVHRPQPPASPIETTLDSLKKTLASVSRSPVTGRKVNPNQQPPQASPPSPPEAAPQSPGAQDIQRKMKQLRKINLKQDSSWMNKHNLQSPPNSPPAAPTHQFAPNFPAPKVEPQQHQPHVIQHIVQKPDTPPAAAPSKVDVRNVVSFARDLADSPNRYPDKVVVSTKTRTEPDGRTIKETTTTRTGPDGRTETTTTTTTTSLAPNGAHPAASALAGNAAAPGILDDDMFFSNLRFVIDENGDIRPNTFAKFQQL